MATNKHALIRYEVIDKYLQKRSGYNTYKNLSKECREEIIRREDASDIAEICLRTFRADIKYLREASLAKGVDIEFRLGGEGYYYFYSDPTYSYFKKSLTSSQIGQLKCAFQLLDKFKGLPEYDGLSALAEQLKDKYGIVGNDVYVEYEHAESTGEEMMPDICSCIINKQPIRITYLPFEKEEKEWIIHPYLLKEFNNRWFLFGYNETEGKVSNLPLDRVGYDFEPVPNVFIQNSFIDFSTYFDDVVGVSVPNFPPSEIILQASENRFPYIASKKIHKSQEIIDMTNRKILLKLIPNKELDALILSFGEDLEVISPEWYRARIIRKVEALHNKYLGGKDNCTPSVDLCDVNH